jgi:PKD repeat protein
MMRQVKRWGALLLIVFLLHAPAGYGQVVAGISANGQVLPRGATVNVCQGSTIAFQSVAQGATTINWSFSGGSPSTGAGTGPFSIAYNNPGFDTVYQKVTSAGSADSTYAIVQVSGIRPTAAFTYAPNNMCANIPVQFTNQSAGTGLSYAWNFGDGNSSTAANPSWQFLSAVGASGTQSYTVTLVVTNVYGCQAQASQTVTVDNVPDASIGNGDPTVLFNTFNGNPTFKKCNYLPSYTFSFTNQSSTNSINTGYTIQWGDGSPDSVFSSWPASAVIMHTFPLGSSTMTVRVTGADGCIGIKTYTVFLGSTPAGGLASLGNADICAADSLNFAISNFALNPPGTQYSFLINDGSNPLVFNQPPPAIVGHFFSQGSCGFTSSSGNNSYANAFGAYLTIANPCGTTSPSVVPIYVSGKPIASFAVSPASVTCVNTPVALVNTSAFGNVVTATGGTGSSCTNNGNQVWVITPASGYTITGGTAGSLNGNPGNGLLWTSGAGTLDLQFTLPGAYTVKLYISNNRCGADSTVQTICVRNPPAASFTMSQHKSCGPGSPLITNTSPTGGCQGDLYSWQVTYLDPLGCGSGQGAAYAFINNTNAASFSPSLQFNQPGKYIVLLTVTAANAASACPPISFQDTFTVIGPPKPNIQPISPICPGDSIRPSATVDSCYSPGPFTYQWTFPAGNPAGASTLIPGYVVYADTGSNPVQLTVTDAFCSTTATSAVTAVVLALPKANPGRDTTACSGTTLTLGAPGIPGVTYQWSPATGLSDPTVANPTLTLTYSGPAPDTVLGYRLQASLGAACTSVDSVHITVDREPALRIQPANPAICIGDSVRLVAAGANTYAWSPAGSLSAPSGDSIVAKPAATTTYLVTGSLAGGCSDTLTVTVIVHPNADAGFTAQDSILCSGSNLDGSIQVSPSPGDSLYNWYADEVLIGSSPNPVFPSFSLNGAGSTDTIKLITIAPFGCLPDSAEKVFATIPGLTTRFSQNVDSGCGPLKVYWRNLSSQLTGVQFFWDFGNGSTSNLTQPDTLVYNSNPFYRDTTYYITLKAYNGCDTTSFMDSVLVFPAARAAFAIGRVTGCSPFTDTLVNISSGNNSAFYWDFGDGGQDTVTTMTPLIHTYHTDVVDTFTIRLTALNQCGEDQDSIDVVVAPNNIRTDFILNGNDLYGCAPHLAHFVNSTAGATQIFIDYGDGSPPDTIAGSQNAISHLYQQPGAYQVLTRFVNTCTDTSTSLTVQVYPSPAPNFTVAPDPICTGHTLYTQNASTNADSYLWDWGDSSTGTGDAPTHLYMRSGSYQVNMTALRVNTAGTVCSVNAAPVTVTVVDLIPALIGRGPGKPCVPYTLTVTATGAENASSIDWLFYDSTRSPWVFYAQGMTAAYQYLSPGIYGVKLIVTNLAGCADTASLDIPVSPTPSLVLKPVGTIYTCNTDTTLNFSVSSTYTGSDPLYYTWLINQQPAGTGSTLSYRFQWPPDSLAEGIFTITAVVSDSAGCADSATAGTLDIRPLPPPVIAIHPDSVLSQPDYTFTFLDSTNTPFTISYLWDFGDGSPQHTGPEQTHQYGDTGVYWVMLRIRDEVTGCVNADTAHVRILYVPGWLAVPDAICPGCSEAGLRQFLPKGIGLKDYRLRIYNIWGQLLFETTSLDGDGSPNQPWDARWMNTPVSQDAYRWQIEAHYINGTEWKGMKYPNHESPVKSGFITVIK